MGAKGPRGTEGPEDRLIAGCRSWDDFARRVEALPLPKKRGDAFERLTQLYLQTIPEYASRLRHVWLLEEVPQSVRKKLNLSGPDEGIDLVARERDGTYWAIQAKFRSHKERALRKDDLGLAVVDHARIFAEIQNSVRGPRNRPAY